jgi:hypothetical protein
MQADLKAYVSTNSMAPNKALELLIRLNVASRIATSD